MAAAGAKKVYAVEASYTSELIESIANDNGFGNVIEVIPKRVEDISSLPNNEKVDVIVSEWMGFYLLHESMLNSVIIARDCFLADDGKIFPSEARIYAAPCTLVNLYEEQIDFWEDVHGFNMSAMRNYAMKRKMIKPEITVIPASDLLAEPVCIKTFLLDSIIEEDIKEISETTFVGITRAGQYQGLCLWFECDFDGREYDEDGEETGKIITLSTSPFNPVTHWKQTVIFFGNNDEGDDVARQQNGDDKSKSDAEPTRKESGISMASEVEMEVADEAADHQDEGVPDALLPSRSSHYEVEEDNVVGWKLNLVQNSENGRHYDVTFEMLDPEVDEHPIPCPCPMPRCLIIAKMIEKEDELVDDE